MLRNVPPARLVTANSHVRGQRTRGSPSFSAVFQEGGRIAPAQAQTGCCSGSPFSVSASPGGSSAGGQLSLITQGWASMMARTGR